MLYNIAGVIFIIIAIWGGIYTYKNKNDMPFSAFGLQKEKYQVINNIKFNRLMLTQSIVESLWYILTALFCVIIKDVLIIVCFPSVNIFILLIFRKISKKYIKKK